MYRSVDVTVHPLVTGLGLGSNTSQLSGTAVLFPLFLFGTVTVVVPRAPPGVQLHMELSLLPGFLIVLCLLLATQRMPLRTYDTLYYEQTDSARVGRQYTLRSLLLLGIGSVPGSAAVTGRGNGDPIGIVIDLRKFPFLWLNKPDQKNKLSTMYNLLGRYMSWEKCCYF